MLGRMASDTDAPGLANSLPLLSRLKPAGFAALAFVLVAAGWFAAQVVVLDHSAAAAMTTSVTRSTTPLRPDTPIQITLQGAGVQLQGAQLWRADVAADGSRGPE